jgi:hypothetical protein
MVNRANVEFYQFYELIKNEGLSSLLYVTDNGQPAKMGNDLERLMKQARVFMEKIGRMEEWSGESVASLLIVMAAREDGSGVMPRFQSCVSWAHVEYLWRVHLGPKPGEYRIECFEVENGQEAFMESMTKIAWPPEAGL